MDCEEDTGNALCTEPLASVLGYLSRRVGVHFAGRELGSVERKLVAVAARHGLGDLRGLSMCLAMGPSAELERELIDAVSINYTYFCREPRVLEVWVRKTLPDHLARHETVRIWSAACSTGQEAYTLAMLAIEQLGEFEFFRRVRIIGTDIHSPSVGAAELGVYSGRALETLPAHWRARFFEPRGVDALQVKASVREACVFRRLNLHTRPWPFRNRFHTVFCRNVLYYFGELDRRALLSALCDSLTPDGVLVTSLTEPIGRDFPQVRECGAGIYVRSEALKR